MEDKIPRKEVGLRIQVREIFYRLPALNVNKRATLQISVQMHLFLKKIAKTVAKIVKICLENSKINNNQLLYKGATKRIIVKIDQ